MLLQYELLLTVNDKHGGKHGDEDAHTHQLQACSRKRTIVPVITTQFLNKRL